VATPVAAPVAAPVPVATPVAGPVSSEVGAIATEILLVHDTPKYSETTLVPRLLKNAIDAKNKDRNTAVLNGLGSLAADVKASLDTTPSRPRSALATGPGYATFSMMEKLSDPTFRSGVAQALVSVQDLKDRKFLPSTINQIAAGLRNAMQQKLLLGGRTRRRRGRRATRRSP
jgi:hypothetical protein